MKCTKSPYYILKTRRLSKSPTPCLLKMETPRSLDFAQAVAGGSRRAVTAILSTGPVLRIRIPTRLRIGGVVVAAAVVVVARIPVVARGPEARTQEEVDVDKGSQVRGSDSRRS